MNRASNSPITFRCLAAPVSVLAALAYIDPGTGSLILQILLAWLVGSLFVIKLFWRSIGHFFLRLFGKAPDAAPDDAPESSSETEPLKDETA